ncbi:hypothetical protein MRX96_043863 [Rhipicephalus microplus]
MANGDERNAYNERLIDVIERERPLWDLRDRNYKSRAVTDAAWRHVATVMGSTGQVGTWNPCLPGRVHLMFWHQNQSASLKTCLMSFLEIRGRPPVRVYHHRQKKTEAFQIR